MIVIKRVNDCFGAVIIDRRRGKFGHEATVEVENSMPESRPSPQTVACHLRYFTYIELNDWFR